MTKKLLDLPEASPNDPIYTRGFAIGVQRSKPSSPNTQEKQQPSGSKSNDSSPKEELSPEEQRQQVSLGKAIDQALAENPYGSRESTTPDGHRPS